jgi:organizing structure protein 2
MQYTEISPHQPRKSIYDDHSDPPSSSNPRRSLKPSQSTSPTARLAAQIARGRLTIHTYAAAAEDRTNALLTRAFRLEHSFTSTIAALAPAPQTQERVLPGAIYVLIAAMGASITVRNRNVLLRAGVPLVVGVGAGYVLIPATMRNVGELVWRFEERWPVVAETHVRVRERVSGFVGTGVAHSRMGAAMLEERIGEARERVERWVAKGR